jgi:chemotaxis protein CheX
MDLIDPFAKAAEHVFKTMLGCELQAEPRTESTSPVLSCQINGMISVSGQLTATLIVGVSESVALAATEGLLGSKPSTVNEEVLDAVGELTNMIGGNAKARLSQFPSKLTVPTVFQGTGVRVTFDPSITPAHSIPFQSDWGPVVLQVGVLCVEAKRAAESPALAGAN